MKGFLPRKFLHPAVAISPPLPQDKIPTGILRRELHGEPTLVKAYCTVEDGKDTAEWACRTATLATVADVLPSYLFYKMNLWMITLLYLHHIGRFSAE